MMKIIALMPVKNEAWILRSTLSALSEYCDFIFVSDQNSTDGSREIISEFEKVILLNNNSDGHSNRVRWQLLDAAREISGNNLILNIDADEAFSPRLFKKFLNDYKGKLVPGTWIEFQWVQLWKSISYYREDDSVWSNNWKPIGFLDDRKLDYPRVQVINDHTSRVRGKSDTPTIRIENVPLLHYQWAAWHRAQAKQAWYRCAELIDNPKAARSINEKYAASLEDMSAQLTEVPVEWSYEINVLSTIEQTPPDWHLDEIMQWFDRYSIKFFESLDIWHVSELRAEYIKKYGKYPPTRGYLKTHLFLRSVKNFFRIR